MNRRRFLTAALGVAGAALVPIPTPTAQASLGQLTEDQVRRRLDRVLRDGLRRDGWYRLPLSAADTATLGKLRVVVQDDGHFRLPVHKSKELLNLLAAGG